MKTTFVQFFYCRHKLNIFSLQSFWVFLIYTNEKSAFSDSRKFPSIIFQGNLSLNTIQFVAKPLSSLHIKSAIRHSASKENLKANEWHSRPEMASSDNKKK